MFVKFFPFIARNGKLLLEEREKERKRVEKVDSLTGDWIVKIGSWCNEKSYTISTSDFFANSLMLNYLFRYQFIFFIKLIKMKTR